MNDIGEIMLRLIHKLILVTIRIFYAHHQQLRHTTSTFSLNIMSQQLFLLTGSIQPGWPTGRRPRQRTIAQALKRYSSAGRWNRPSDKLFTLHNANGKIKYLTCAQQLTRYAELSPPHLDRNYTKKINE